MKVTIAEWIPIDLTPYTDEYGYFNEYGDVGPDGTWICFAEDYPDFFRARRLFRLKDGTSLLAGDVNKNWGGCDCCGRGGRGQVVAYADLNIEED